MKLDPDKLRAEAAAHQARMQSPLWAESDGEKVENWTVPLQVGAHPGGAAAYRILEDQRATPRSAEMALEVHRNSPVSAALPRLDALEQTLGKLTEVIRRRPEGNELPGWLELAAGNPHTYDAPDSERVAVCARLLPTTYAQLQRAQRQLGLRTTAGAWEFLLRLGLAAAERLKLREP